jgi:uncharacterized membrane protein
MIEAHTTDAWTRAASKTTVGFRNATILGGFAAPLFLWLAGIGTALSAARVWQRTRNRTAVVETVARRGLEIFVLAFLFRLQAFVVSPGGSPLMLFRVDILNIMGPAIAFAGALWLLGDGARGRAVAFSVVAVAIALVTPIVRAATFVDSLPTWVQWYIRPSGEHTTFTAFPWIGFVFAGAAAGSLIAAADDERVERRLQAAFALVGAALIALGLVTASRPSIYVSSSFWTSSPTWFAIRVGVMMMVLAGLKACTTSLSDAHVVQALKPAVDAIARIGRASLFIYWIHVELVYGYASWFWRGRLPLWATLVAYLLFSTLMFGAVVLRDRVTIAWRARQAVVPSTTA